MYARPSPRRHPSSLSMAHRASPTSRKSAKKRQYVLFTDNLPRPTSPWHLVPRYSFRRAVLTLNANPLISMTFTSSRAAVMVWSKTFARVSWASMSSKLYQVPSIVLVSSDIEIVPSSARIQPTRDIDTCGLPVVNRIESMGIVHSTA